MGGTKSRWQGRRHIQAGDAQHNAGMLSIPEVNQQLSLGEVLHLIPGDVVDRHSLIATALQAAVDVEQKIHVVVPAMTNL